MQQGPIKSRFVAFSVLGILHPFPYAVKGFFPYLRIQLQQGPELLGGFRMHQPIGFAVLKVGQGLSRNSYSGKNSTST